MYISKHLFDQKKLNSTGTLLKSPEHYDTKKCRFHHIQCDIGESLEATIKTDKRGTVTAHIITTQKS